MLKSWVLVACTYWTHPKMLTPLSLQSRWGALSSISGGPRWQRPFHFQHRFQRSLWMSVSSRRPEGKERQKACSFSAFAQTYKSVFSTPRASCDRQLPLKHEYRLENYRLGLWEIVKITMKTFSKQILICPACQFILPSSCHFPSRLLSCLWKVYFSKCLFHLHTKKMKSPYNCVDLRKK